MTFKFEKRAHPRSAYELEGRAEVINRRSAAPGPFPAHLVNVGGGGIAVTLDAELSTGDLLRFTLRPPTGASASTGTPPAPLSLDAQVVWIRRNGMRLIGSFTAGLMFRPAGQDGAARLVAIAEQELSAGVPADRALVGEEGMP